MSEEYQNKARQEAANAPAEEETAPVTGNDTAPMIGSDTAAASPLPTDETSEAQASPQAETVPIIGSDTVAAADTPFATDETNGAQTSPQAETVPIIGSDTVAASPLPTDETNGAQTSPEAETVPIIGSGTAAAAAAETAANGAKKRKIPRYLLTAIAAVALALIVLATVLIVNLVRGRRAPALSEVKERFSTLIAASAGVNTVLFGRGLPTYPRVYEEREPHTVTFKGEEYTVYTYTFEDSEVGTVVGYQYYVLIPETGADGVTRYVAYDIASGAALGSAGYARYRFAEKTTEEREGAIYAADGYYYYALPDYKEPDFYYTAEDYDDYDYVREDAPYHSTAEIREAASAVYAGAYLQSVYGSLFDGVAGGDGQAVLLARYIDYRRDGVSYLMQSNAVGGYDLPQRRYDFDTMRAVRGGNSKYMTVEIESYTKDDQSDRAPVKIAFAKENGEWYLDSPTY